jgi:hypothetical protein
MDDDEIPPPAKRPRRMAIINTEELIRGPDVMIRLLDEDTRNLGLSHPIIMEFHRLDCLIFNSSIVSYLYLICIIIFDIDNKKIILTHSPIIKTIKSLYNDDYHEYRFIAGIYGSIVSI